MVTFVLPLHSQRSHPGSADEAENITDEELEGKLSPFFSWSFVLGN